MLPLSRPGGAPSVAADLADTDTVFPGMEAAQDEVEHIGTVITPAARDALLPDELKTKKIHKLNMVTRTMEVDISHQKYMHLSKKRNIC